MINIEVGISESMDEFPRPQSTHLSDHQSQQPVGGYVEGNAEEHVRAPLIELAAQAAAANVKLE